MQLIRSKISQYFSRHNFSTFAGVSCITLVWFVLVLTNFELGTRLLGWDVMDSSFNPLLGIWRSLFGMWQSFQGLGLLGGHGYQAQLPHALMTLIMSLFVPAVYIRYIFAFGMLWLGAVGCFALITYLFRTQSKKTVTFWGALAGSLVYLLHYATVQTFYVFLEPFIIMYGVFPWVLLILFGLLEKPTLKRWFLFLFLNFAISVIGFIPPMFISYVAFIGIALLSYLIIKHSFTALKTVLLIGCCLVFSHAYWLLPLGYYTLTHSSVYLSSKLNQYSTPEFIVKNKSYGELSNLALMNSFYAESLDQARFDTSKPYQSVLTPWITHFESPTVKVFAYSIFTLAVAGLLIGLLLLFVRPRPEWSVGVMGVLTLSWLGTGVPILKETSLLFRLIPFLNQAFRIPFTKLSMSMSLFLAVGVATFFIVVTHLLLKMFKGTHSEKRNKYIVWFSSFVILLFCLTTLYYSLPSFQGHFFYKGARVDFPDAYKNAISFFRTQPQQSRIAPFPILTTTGWDMHRWPNQRGYTGSGFWWYAISQPMLHRSFDVWSGYNETYYDQISTAIYGRDASALADLFAKYNVTFVLVDESIYLPNRNTNDFAFETTKELLKKMSAQVVFQEQFLTIYRLPESITAENIKTQSRAEFVEAPVYKTRRLPEYLQGKNFYSSQSQSSAATTFLPFANVFAEQLALTDAENNMLKLESSVKLPTGKFEVVIPGQTVNNIFNTFTNITYKDKTVSIDFIALEDLQIGKTNVSIPTPSPITITLPESYPKVTLQISDQVIELERDQQAKTTFLRIPTDRENTIEAAPTEITPQTGQVLTLDDKQQKSVSVKIDADTWKQVTAEQRIPVDVFQGQNVITARFDKISLPTSITGKTAYNCETLQPLPENKKIANGQVTYQAQNNQAVCDYYPLTNLNYAQTYILQLKGKQETGRGLKFYLQNAQTHRADIENLLPDKNFNQYYSILNWPLLEHPVNINGYTLNVENRSYGQQESRNNLENVSVFSAPLSLLSNIRIVPVGQSPQTVVFADVQKIKTLGTFIAQFEIKENAAQTLLDTDQAYDQGWIAFTPSLRPLTQKVIINGWGNGWLIPAGTTSVIAFYWPQLLEFIGLFLALAMYAYFFLYWKMKSAKVTLVKQQNTIVVNHKQKHSLPSKIKQHFSGNKK